MTAPNPNQPPANNDEDDDDEEEGVDAIDTAINSCRRSRRKALKASDKDVAVIMVRAEAELLGLYADRMGQPSLPGIDG